MIKVEHITKKFVRNKNKKEKEVFLADDDITFEANDGEIIGILGPNGAGKTTLLRMIAGILEPTQGKISFDGMNLKLKLSKILLIYQEIQKFMIHYQLMNY